MALTPPRILGITLQNDVGHHRRNVVAELVDLPQGLSAKKIFRGLTQRGPQALHAVGLAIFGNVSCPDKAFVGCRTSVGIAPVTGFSFSSPELFRVIEWLFHGTSSRLVSESRYFIGRVVCHHNLRASVR
jgi:hypothetical protein